MSEFNEEKWLQENAVKILKNADMYISECSGCCETVDGHNSMGYPISYTFNCLVGSGCSECDNTGVTAQDIKDYFYYSKCEELKDKIQEMTEVIKKLEDRLGSFASFLCRLNDAYLELETEDFIKVSKEMIEDHELVKKYTRGVE
ncbi:MAG: hypothetical protein Unbinned5081contig1003_33 [Prokaryotic dsDNA virus sp.]|nr:MAG: hypothetical protein Unbinned5081contig1003_33 [Prokaryotic dsDNA virus sp.]|tara:strand:- start:33778 stop:34212 length:435 start_codon:yes stop_codon:yes gene_type:complete